MKKLFLFLMMMFALSKMEAQALLYIDSSMVSFDTVMAGSSFDTQWFIANNGDKPLVIDSIFFDGDFCASYWPKHPLAPGDTAFLMVACKCNVAGEYHCNMFIQTNSGKKGNTMYKIRLEAYVREEK